MKTVALIVLALPFVAGCISQKVWRPDHPNGEKLNEYQAINVEADVYLKENSKIVTGVIINDSGNMHILIPAYRDELFDIPTKQYRIVCRHCDGMDSWVIEGDIILPMDLKECQIIAMNGPQNYKLKAEFRNRVDYLDLKLRESQKVRMRVSHIEVVRVNSYDVVPTIGRVIVTPFTLAIDIVMTPFCLAYLFVSGFHG